MVNNNASITETVPDITHNRGFLYGDAVFETFKIINKKILFFEDHYFRLMSSMRILRMKIPMNFTMEYIEKQIFDLLPEGGGFRVRMTVYRNPGGRYLPETNEVSYLITFEKIEHIAYQVFDEKYEIELYKDFYQPKQLLSNVKSNNRILQVIGSIFASENGFDNCLIMNEQKNIIEALNGNVFLFLDNALITPPVSDGCINGVMRKQVIALAKDMGYKVDETSVSPFNLQKADEIFITNVIFGLKSVTQYRKKNFSTSIATILTEKLNQKILSESPDLN
ncbi:MAG: aminotransferase class IV [Flavobacteriaceae bacterium]|jgi:branched-chain amino acid aminotransferase|nr:aminotransferase class IV [Flavobacteriaceae bacterium]